VGIFISAIGILMFWCYAKYTQPGVPLHNFFGDCPGCYYKAQQAKLEGTAQPEEEED
jgi:hypothetical protein